MTDKRKFLEVCKRCIYSTKSGDVRICLGREAIKNGTNWTIACEAWSDLGKCDIFEDNGEYMNDKESLEHIEDCLMDSIHYIENRYSIKMEGVMKICPEIVTRLNTIHRDLQEVLTDITEITDQME